VLRKIQLNYYFEGNQKLGGIKYELLYAALFPGLNTITAFSKNYDLTIF